MNTPIVQIRRSDSHVAELVWTRPPNNFLDVDLLREICDALDMLDSENGCRVVVLAPGGKHFCAGSDLAGRKRTDDQDASSSLYAQALRLFNTKKPLIAAVQGAAIGAGLGLALAADFRVVADDVRLSANFSRLGYFPGFGLTATLPRLIGIQKASMLLYSGKRVQANEAIALGLADVAVPRTELRDAAFEFALQFAESAPLSVVAIRSRLRADIRASIAEVISCETGEQGKLRTTKDFLEGVRASAERRLPSFTAE